KLAFEKYVSKVVLPVGFSTFGYVHESAKRFAEPLAGVLIDLADKSASSQGMGCRSVSGCCMWGHEVQALPDCTSIGCRDIPHSRVGGGLGISQGLCVSLGHWRIDMGPAGVGRNGGAGFC
ncbi:17610_t:CDS:2, partial [Racocetra persica]